MKEEDVIVGYKYYFRPYITLPDVEEGLCIGRYHGGAIIRRYKRPALSDVEVPFNRVLTHVQYKKPGFLTKLFRGY